jgi:hypothetical protein
MKTPEVPTETTTCWLFESVIVATEPTFTVEPFGRTTPDDPGTALIVSLPTVAIAAAEVGVVGGVSSRSGWVLETGGLPGSVKDEGAAGDDVDAAAGAP